LQRGGMVVNSKFQDQEMIHLDSEDGRQFHAVNADSGLR
jgi:hypothetical protein